MVTTGNESLMHTGTIWFPEAGSALAGQTDLLFYTIFVASVLFFLVLIGITAFFLVKYKRSGKHTAALKQITHNDKLEIIWSVIPLIVVMGIFYWGYMEYLKLIVPPANTVDIHVTGKKWMWQFEYPQGKQTLTDLVVPVNQPIKLIMSSEDVLHSFYLPNFRVKKDVIPNRYTVLWFSPERVGNFQIFCTEYCGDGHSQMLGNLKVVSAEDYQKFLTEEEGKDIPDDQLDKLGAKLYVSKGCVACHSLDGKPGVGPSWKGLYGSKRTFSNAPAEVADDNYIRESVVKPGAKVVTGFGPVMPTFSGLLSDREITGIIAYIKTIK
ncbi:MAG: cytochrome c oxidase subunit II [Candidatus Margulisiibacteriota bacterium]